MATYDVTYPAQVYFSVAPDDRIEDLAETFNLKRMGSGMGCGERDLELFGLTLKPAELFMLQEDLQKIHPEIKIEKR